MTEKWVGEKKKQKEETFLCNNFLHSSNNQYTSTPYTMSSFKILLYINYSYSATYIDSWFISTNIFLMTWKLPTTVEQITPDYQCDPFNVPIAFTTDVIFYAIQNKTNAFKVFQIQHYNINQSLCCELELYLCSASKSCTCALTVCSLWEENCITKFSEIQCLIAP